MELVAQRGLPVAPAVVEAPLMTGDSEPVVTVPLTNGFARTGYEQDLAVAAGGGEQKSGVAEVEDGSRCGGLSYVVSQVSKSESWGTQRYRKTNWASA